MSCRPRRSAWSVTSSSSSNASRRRSYWALSSGRSWKRTCAERCCSRAGTRRCSSSARSASPCFSSPGSCSRSSSRRRCARSARKRSSRPDGGNTPGVPEFRDSRIVGVALSVFALLPEHVAAAAFAVEDTAENEKQIGQAVQVDARGVADFLCVRQGDERALGAPAHRAREVSEARGARPAWQDKFLQVRQRGIEFVEERLKPLSLAVGHGRAARDRDVAAQIEQVVLDALENPVDFFRDRLGEKHADRRIELVDFAQGNDARTVFANARTVAQSGFAAVAGAGGDFGKTVTHEEDGRQPNIAWGVSTGVNPGARISMLTERVEATLEGK